MKPQRALSWRRGSQRKKNEKESRRFSLRSLRTQRLFFFLLAMLFFQNVYAQNDTLRFLESSPVLNHHRMNLVKYSAIGLYPVSMYWLYKQWYKDYPQSSFHFFNDEGEWQQMDKCGHVLTSYTVGKAGFKALQWAGEENKKAIWYGAGIGFLFQATVEVFDGFSSQWGFSATDIAANTLGTAIFISQQLAWNEQRIQLKFSFHQSDYSNYRPNVLGSNLAENILKDYNGQTYWISANPYSFMNKDSKFPKCLNVAVGYGANGMIGGYSNPSVVGDQTVPQFDRYRQYYLSLDVDLTKIQTRSKFLSAAFKLINVIKLPAPAIEFNNGHKTKFHALYF